MMRPGSCGQPALPTPAVRQPGGGGVTISRHPLAFAPGRHDVLVRPEGTVGLAGASSSDGIAMLPTNDVSRETSRITTVDADVILIEPAALTTLLVET